MAGRVLVTAPPIEPVTVAETKAWERITGAAEDDLVESLIVSARKRLEERGDIAFINQAWDLFLDQFPTGHELAIELPKYPLVSVTSITYTDTAGAETTMPTADYQVDTAARPGRVVPAYGTVWPSTVLRPANGVAIRFVAGHGTGGDDVPQQLRTRIMELVGFWYERRDTSETPDALDTGMLESYPRTYA
jgi:uncharacterized phiE125 gp8 family phage protein